MSEDQAQQPSPWDGWTDVYLDWHLALDLDDGPFYRRLRDEHAGFVVELGCGDGRLFEAVEPDLGLDTSEGMLDRARRHPAGVPVAYGDALTFTLDRPATLIYAAMNTMNHVGDNDAQDQALANVRANLAPGGVFAFDALCTNAEEISRRNANLQLRHRTDEWVVLTAVRRVGGGLDMEWYGVVDEIDPDGYVTRRRHLSPVSLVPRTPEDWADAAQRTGWELESHWSDFDGSPVLETGWQVVVLRNP